MYFIMTYLYYYYYYHRHHNFILLLECLFYKKPIGVFRPVMTEYARPLTGHGERSRSAWVGITGIARDRPGSPL